MNLFIKMDLDLKPADIELVSEGEKSPRGGVQGNEHCVAVLSRKARVIYMYKSKPKLR